MARFGTGEYHFVYFAVTLTTIPDIYGLKVGVYTRNRERLALCRQYNYSVALRP
jgi:hypothetical protein